MYVIGGLECLGLRWLSLLGVQSMNRWMNKEQGCNFFFFFMPIHCGYYDMVLRYCLYDEDNLIFITCSSFVLYGPGSGVH